MLSIRSLHVSYPCNSCIACCPYPHCMFPFHITLVLHAVHTLIACFWPWHVQPKPEQMNPMVEFITNRKCFNYTFATWCQQNHLNYREVLHEVGFWLRVK